MKSQKQFMSLLIVFIFTALLFIHASPTETWGNKKETEPPVRLEKSNAGGSGAFEQEGEEIPQIKKKHFPWLLVAAGVVVAGVVLYFTVFKKPKRTLTVQLRAGVAGSPAQGNHEYKKGVKVEYDYSPLEGYFALSVTLDGTKIPAKGTILMDKDHTLDVYASPSPTLSVRIEEGADGHPAAGTHIQEKNSLVYYSYYSIAGYHLQVLLDGAPVNNSGSFKMDRNHALEVTTTLVGAVSLTVQVGEGILGYPSEGTRVQTRNETIEYNYFPYNGFRNLRVTLDGKEIPVSGSLLLDSDHTLAATADPPPYFFDIRGDWVLEITPTSGNCFGGVTVLDPVTFRGPDYYSGKVDFPQGSHINSPSSFTVNFRKVLFNSWYMSSYNILSFEGYTDDGNLVTGTYSCGGYKGDCSEKGTFRMWRKN